MMLHILGVFEHINHKVNDIVSGYLLVALEHLSDVCKRCCSVEGGLEIPC